MAFFFVQYPLYSDTIINVYDNQICFAKVGTHYFRQCRWMDRTVNQIAESICHLAPDAGHGIYCKQMLLDRLMLERCGSHVSYYTRCKVDPNGEDEDNVVLSCVSSETCLVNSKLYCCL